MATTASNPANVISASRAYIECSRDNGCDIEILDGPFPAYGGFSGNCLARNCLSEYQQLKTAQLAEALRLISIVNNGAIGATSAAPGATSAAPGHLVVGIWLLAVIVAAMTLV